MNTTALEEKKAILLTFDVEDWFQVENFKEYIPFSSWDSHQLRVEKNTHTILDLLDSFSFKPKATFFILGWIARKLPHLVKQISERGHEVASHGDLHHLCTLQDTNELLQDLIKSKKLLEDLLGEEISGYRAPSFGINNQILRYVCDAGYQYDSSYNSFALHGRYGSIDLPNIKKGIATRVFDNFFEIPISNLTLFKRVFPLGGGGYFRLFPFLTFKYGMKFMLKKDPAFVFYSHPWEFDPDQPKVDQAAPNYKFRHYINLDKTRFKLKKMIQVFNHAEFLSCKDYLRKNK